MATNPINDPIRQLTAMAQLARQNQALAGHVDRVVMAVSDLSKDTRSGFRNVNTSVETGVEAIRAEMNERFRAVGARFDELEERLMRIEDGMKEVHSDLLRLQNDVAKAQQSALEAHLRLDNHGDDGQEP